MQTFGDRLKMLRKERGMTGTELGRLLNVSKVAISNWENGNRFPDKDMLLKIAELFNVSVDYLLGKTDVRNQEPSISKPDMPRFTPKEERDIAKRLEKMREDLLQQQGLMFYGEPVSEEAIESILAALEFGIRQAKIINKKYTPKKYRKDNE
ncbi:MAG: hypothetical protein JG776_495 [Caloramator sp.]|jgi:transcriptional regulator with XRE-family HTH domain|uniref:helix-turn-helix domain-containing protein n=1 Tax=Caloramator sp. TaxID=1871330 RepID=UPI001D6F0EF0|nr:helix-turn-helix domain-containing protein [Caloramator sp.]MBZ4662813.1 hypothetical protein [Caloramator sp.]